MEGIYIILIILIILIGSLLIANYANIMNIESFDDFSPYSGNQSYPYVYQKHLDQQLLNKTLNKWEKPFNCNDEGYWNAEPKGKPPFVPIYSYPQMKGRQFVKMDDRRENTIKECSTNDDLSYLARVDDTI